MRYRPTAASFAASALLAMAPALVAGSVAYFARERFTLVVWIVSGAMVLFSLALLLQAIVVHRATLDVDEEHVRWTVLGNAQEMAWRDVSTALLRERPNTVTRPDRVLVLHGGRRRFAINVSTLAPADEEAVLELVRRKTNLVVQRDTPVA